MIFERSLSWAEFGPMWRIQVKCLVVAFNAGTTDFYVEIYNQNFWYSRWRAVLVVD